MSHLELFLFGPPRLEQDGQSLEIDARKTMALLSYLAVTGNSHSRETMMALLWPELESRRAQNVLRRNLSTLNKTLGGAWLVAERDIIGLDEETDAWVDVVHFRRLARSWQGHNHAQSDLCPDCLNDLAEAAALYRTDFLAGFSVRNSPNFDDWQVLEAEQIKRELAAVLERLVQGHSDRGQFDQAISYGQRWLALDPLHEPAHQMLMRLYTWSGQQTAALRQYQVCAEMLEAEFGVPPSTETTALYERIRTGAEAQGSRGAGEQGRKDTHPHPTFLIGGRYEIGDRTQDLIGQGSMGHVFKGRDIETGEAVAIKALRPEFLVNEANLVERFTREGQILRQLNHLNIVQLRDAITEADKHYLVMDYVSGGSLKALLNQDDPLAISRALDITLELSDALTQTHHRHIIHRDIKPANVLIDEDGSPRLTDFGVARLGQAERVTQTGVAIGTLDYLAPEALNGDAIDARADIWSLGVLLFEMLAQQRPFVGQSPTEVLTAILTQPPPNLKALRPDLPSALVDLVGQMLRKDPPERISSMRQVGARLEKIREEAPPVSQSKEAKSPLTLSEARKHNLPPQTTPFLGRETELADLTQMLAEPDTRLITVLGPGGMGKTRLTLQAAEGQLDHYRDGVFFVSLAPLSDPNMIVSALAEAFDFVFQADQRPPQQQILDYLRQKNRLLVLDNFEHLLSETTGLDLVQEILQVAPEVDILVTSRERLKLSQEQLYVLEGLSYPDGTGDDQDHYTALDLFAQVFKRVRPSFVQTEEDQTAMAEICRYVQGMPLGILLAASWGEMLSPSEIAAEIAAEDGQGLDFLESDLHDLPDRQRSLGIVFSQTWQRLSRQEQTAFSQLSVFRGGFTREAAQAVTGSPLPLLMKLAHKSLLTCAPAGRYEIHELLRQYGAGKLAQEPARYQAVRDKHSAFYAAFLHQRETDLHGPRQGQVMDDIEADIENIRLAWTWAVQAGNVAQLEQSIESLGVFYAYHGLYQEGVANYQLVIEHLQKSGTDLDDFSTEAKSLNPDLIETGWAVAKILRWQSDFNASSGNTELALQNLEQCQTMIEALNDNGQHALKERAEWAYRQAIRLHAIGQREVALKYVQEAVMLAQESGAVYLEAMSNLEWGLLQTVIGSQQAGLERIEKALTLARSARLGYAEAECLHNLAPVLWFSGGSYDQTLSYLEAAFSRSQEIGHRSTEARILVKLGYIIVEHGDGDYRQAERYYQQSWTIDQESADQTGLLHKCFNLGLLYDHLGEYGRSLRFLKQGLDLNRKIQGITEKCRLSSYLANLYRSQGDYEKARPQYPQALSLLSEANMRQLEGRMWSEYGLFLHQSGADEGALEACRRGLKLSQEVNCIWDYAYAYTRMGYALVSLGRLDEGRSAYQEALKWHADRKQRNRAMEAEAGLARLDLSEGKPDAALHWVEAILEKLNPVSMCSLFEPFRVYLTCYQVLHANRDGRAGDVLNAAHDLLQTRARTIEDEAGQRRYLAEIPVHRDLITAWEAHKDSRSASIEASGQSGWLADPHGRAARPPTLVGRDAEWQTLQSTWDRAAQGQARFVAISGEAGIGKTHLAQAFFTWLRQHGVAPV